jgi:hypothetical protein
MVVMMVDNLSKWANPSEAQQLMVLFLNRSSQPPRGYQLLVDAVSQLMICKLTE